MSVIKEFWIMKGVFVFLKKELPTRITSDKVS